MKSLMVLFASIILSVNVFAADTVICGTSESEDYFQFVVSKVNGFRYRIMKNDDRNQATLIVENGNNICVRATIIDSEPMYPDDPAYASAQRAQGEQVHYVKIHVHDIWTDR